MNDIDLTEAAEAAARARWHRAPERCPWEDLAPAMRDHMRKLVMPVLIVATPAIEAAVREKVAAEIRAVAGDPERTRPARKDAEVTTDYANDFEWAAMVAEDGATS